MLVFRDQLLGDEDLLRVGRSIGDGRMEESARLISLAPDRRLVAYLTNLQNEAGQPLGFGGSDTDYWHSDQEFRKAPATLASLYCLIPPPEGGATSFASTAAENLELDTALLDRLRGLRSTRRPATTHDNAVHHEVAHPVVMTTPRTRREVVYISENTIRFPGVDEAEGQAMKRAVLAQVLRPENVYSHRWRMGDFIIYDNTQLLHRREAFRGTRWLKATKMFAPTEWFAVPAGEVVGD
jgi:taurine dioxygenase